MTRIKCKGMLRLRGSMFSMLNWIFLFALLLTCMPLFASETSEDQETRYWVNRISEAGKQSNYAGTLVVVSSQQIITLHNIHARIDQVPYGLMIKLDGPEQKAYRVGDAIYTIKEKTKEIIADRASLIRIFPSLLRFDYQDLEHLYKIYSVGKDRTAGRMADVIKIEARDRLRFSFQVWLDQESGLPLRGQVFDLDGSIIEQITFGDIQFGLSGQDLLMLKAYLDTLLAQGYKIVEIDFDKIVPDTGLITLRENIPGFKLVRAISRSVPATEHKVGQWVFSDGLASISIFIEPAVDLSKNQEQPMQYVSGITHSLSLYKSGYKVTLVGEVPQSTLVRLAENLEFKPTK